MDDLSHYHSHNGSAIISDEEIAVSIYGLPKSLARPKVGSGRSSWTGNNALHRYHTYNPSRLDQRQFKLAVRNAMHPHLVPNQFMLSPFRIDVTFYFPRPRTHFEGNGQIKEANASDFIEVHKGDVDNLLKFVLDSLQGVVIHDDHRCWHAAAEKRWSPLSETTHGVIRSLGCTSFVVTRMPVTETGAPFLGHPLCDFYDGRFDHA